MMVESSGFAIVCLRRGGLSANDRNHAAAGRHGGTGDRPDRQLALAFPVLSPYTGVVKTLTLRGLTASRSIAMSRRLKREVVIS